MDNLDNFDAIVKTVLHRTREELLVLKRAFQDFNSATERLAIMQPELLGKVTGVTVEQFERFEKLILGETGSIERPSRYIGEQTVRSEIIEKLIDFHAEKIKEAQGR